MMTEQQKILGWMRDNLSAALLVNQLFEVSQIADDFVDDDKPIDKSEAMTRLLTIALVEIPSGEFYRLNAGFLAPLLVSVIAAFNTSNKLKKNQDQDLQAMAWALRDSLEHVLTGCAYIVGGQAWAAQVSLEVTEYFRTNEDRESVADWNNS